VSVFGTETCPGQADERRLTYTDANLYAAIEPQCGDSDASRGS